MKHRYLEEFKDFDFKKNFADIGVEIKIETELGHRFNIKLLNKSKEVIWNFTTEPLVTQFQSKFRRATRKDELEMMLEENSKYIKHSIRYELDIAYYDIAKNSKFKPEYLNPLLSKRERMVKLYKSIDAEIEKEIEKNKQLKINGTLINQIANLAEFSSVVNGKELNRFYNTIEFDDDEQYLKIQLSILDKETNLFLLEDINSATGYRGFIGVKINDTFSMKEDVSYSKTDNKFNYESITEALNTRNNIDIPEVKKVRKLSI